MFLKRRKFTCIAASAAAVTLFLGGPTAIASANPDDSTESSEVDVPVTEVPTPDYTDSDVESTDVVTTDTEDVPDYEQPEGTQWEETNPDDKYIPGNTITEYPTTTDCPPTETEEYPDEENPTEEYPDKENPCCPDEEEEGGGDDNSVDTNVENGNDIDNTNQNANQNTNQQNQENNQEQNVEVNVEGGGGDEVDNSVDIGGVDVNVKVPVDINIDNSVTNVTKITETNESNETTVYTKDRDVIVVKPDGYGHHTIVKWIGKADTLEEACALVAQGTQVVKAPPPAESTTGHNPVPVANVSSTSTYEWGVGGAAALVMIGGAAYLVFTRRSSKSVNNDPGRF